MRHSEYAGFILIMLGFLLQWPTLVMFPVLVVMYVRLAHREEGEALAEFGAAYQEYVAADAPLGPGSRRSCSSTDVGPVSGGSRE